MWLRKLAVGATPIRSRKNTMKKALPRATGEGFFISKPGDILGP
jgi:hypothetical protein